MLDLFGCLLHFTPSPFTDLCTCCWGELDTGCVSAAGMNGWVDELVSILTGDCCLFCVTGDVCSVFWMCVCMLFGMWVCGAGGCGGTPSCGGVFWNSVLVMLAESGGVLYPQASELSGEVSAFSCLFVVCVLTASVVVAGAIG